MAGISPLQRISDGLQGLGYAPEWLEYDYGVWSAAGKTTTVPLVAFSTSQPKDLTTANVVCGVGGASTHEIELFDAAKALAAPAVILARDGELSVWPTLQPQPTRPATIFPVDAAGGLVEYADYLRPRQLNEAKSGVRQLSLFPVDVDLLGNARTQHAQRLAPRIEDAIRAVIRTGHDDLNLEFGSSNLNAPVVARIVMAALAALTLNDKPEYKASTGSASPISSLTSRFPHQFSWIDDPEGQRYLLDAAFERLREGINYRALSPELLADVYEQTLVSEADKRDLGIHYTPHDLAMRLVANIPFETLPPSRRVVLDPTCGSGSLLLAAHERLSVLEANTGTSDEVIHQHLRAALHGTDLDPFAIEVARLSLFLKALPRGDGWDVRQGDALKLSADRVVAPGVILSNPPWKKNGWGADTASQFIEAFLKLALPGTLLGLVVPITWLQGKSSAESREEFHKACEVLEVWRLPEGVFSGAGHAPGAIVARRRGSDDGTMGGYWLYKRALPSKKEELKRFYDRFDGATVETHLLDSSLLGEGPWVSGVLSEALVNWTGLTLKDVCDAKKGPQPLAKSQRPSRRSGTHLFLGAASDFSAFTEVSRSVLQPINYPEDFHGRWAENLVEAEKVLAPATRSANNPWRLKVGVDRFGAAVTSSLHMVAPKSDSDISLEAVLAILGSIFASAWVDERAPGRNISVDILRDLPIPDTASWPELHRLGQSILTTRGDDLRSLLREVDAAVARSLDLADSVTNSLERRFSFFEAPEGGRRYENADVTPEDRDDGVWAYGTVLDVKRDSVCVWVPGVTNDEGEWVRAPSRAPGWACRVGATFSLVGPMDDVAGSRWVFQEYSYFENDEAPHWLSA